MRKLLQYCFKWIIDWWAIIHFGAIVLVLALSPSTYQGGKRALIANKIYTCTWQVLPWFAVLCTLISMVLIRIVVVTAASYGLSYYALEVVVRVLVLELIPLGATLFVVLRSGIAGGIGARVNANLANLAGNARAENAAADSNAPANHVPAIIASAFTVLTLAFVSCLLTLTLAYGLVYGLSPWGFGDYSRTVGRIFDPSTMLMFGVKILLFSLAVGIVPIASESRARATGEPTSDTAPVSRGTVRLFLALILVEAGSLAIKYV